MTSASDGTPNRDLLRTAWQRVLSVQAVHDSDAFISAGGNSLLAMRLAHEIEAATGVQLRPADLLRRSSFADHCELLESGSRDGGVVSERPSPPQGEASKPRPHQQITQAPAAPHHGIPLSISEQHLWFLYRRHPESAAYNESFWFRLPESTDLRALERALLLTWAHEPVLCSTIRESNGVPARLPTNPESICIQHLDAGSSDEESEQVHGLAWRPFDLTQEIPIRTAIIRRENTAPSLIVVLHHIACDLWSIRNLFRRLGHQYREREAHPQSQRAVPRQAVASGTASDQSLAFWTKHLHGIDPRVDLPTDRISSARPPMAPAQHVRIEVDAEDVQGLTSLSKNAGCTAFSTGLSLFSMLLYRHAGSNAFRIGTPFAQRATRATEEGVGYQLSMLPLAIRIDPDASLRSTLTRMHDLVCEAIDHSHVHLADIVPAENDVDEPPFNVAFVFEDDDGPLLELGDAPAHPLPVEPRHAKFDLTLFMQQRSNALDLTFEYREDRFSRATVQNLANHFVGLMRGAADAPDRSIRELTRLMYEADLDALSSLGSGRPQPSTESRIYECFASVARTHPSAPALISTDRRWSYTELLEDVSGVATELLRVGVRPGQRIAICGDPTASFVIAVLGILKVGCSYVPIDAQAPADRRDHILQSAGASGVISTGRQVELAWHGRESAPLEASSAIRELGLAWMPITSGQPTEAHRPERPEAYVMYTSGSTGRPKGVRIDQQAVLHLVRDTDYCEFGVSMRVLLLAPTAFDASTFEIWGPLLNGGTLVAPEIDATDLDALEAVIRERGITTLWLTAALFNTVIDLRASALAPLRDLLIGGEALSVPHVRRAMRELPGTRITNGYGPTEATTFTCTHTIDAPMDEGARSVPLGLPLPGSSVRIVDDRLAPLGIGMPGELAIMGAGLSSGYIDAEEEARRRFKVLSTPQGEERAYLTGDLCRWTPEGTIDFLRRMDTQIKLRGQRIELGEIDSAILSTSTVEQCCTVLHGKGDAARLVAYVVSGDSSQADEADVVDRLKQTLPPYMTPTRVVFVASLPTGATGKVDRGALERRPLPEAKAISGGERGASRWTQQLVRIWRDMLQDETAHEETDFFHAGGNSLLAVRLMSQVGITTGKDIPIGRIFSSPTPATMSREVEAAPDSIADDPLLRLDEDTGGPTIYCIPGLGGHPIDFGPLASHLRGKAQLVGLKYPNPEEMQDYPATVEAYARVLFNRLREASPQDSYRLAGYSLGGLVAFELARRLQTAGLEVEQLLLLDTYPNRLQPKSRIQRAREHLRTLRTMPLAQAAGYIAVRIKRWFGTRFRAKAARETGPGGGAATHTDPIAMGRQASRAYVPSGLTRGLRCTLVRSSHGQSWRQFLKSDPYDQWQPLVPGGLDVQRIDTEHLRLLREPDVAKLALAISATLDEATAVPPQP